MRRREKGTPRIVLGLRRLEQIVLRLSKVYIWAGGGGDTDAERSLSAHLSARSSVSYSTPSAGTGTPSPF